MCYFRSGIVLVFATFKTMTPQQVALLQQLSETGWELAGTEELDQWWADEVWRMRSTWSPQSAELYLTFLVDPQLDLHRKRKPGEGVWAVLASGSLPARWQGSEGDINFGLGHGWSERLEGFVEDLSTFRRGRAREIRD
jgi:hypothetical protein